jgi:hypothetical protein
LLVRHDDSSVAAATELAAESAADGGPKQHFPLWYVGWAVEADCIAYAALGHDPDSLVSVPAEQIATTVRRYTNHPASYLHDIFANEVRPVAFSPTWRTATTVTLAGQMYEERDFCAMPILADASQDVGCDSEAILAHCRGPNCHVRGCWVMDLLLGKG